uniref:Uncharacterized protein n=1 Tax=Rhizophora mucronata TaxID=61149 RepID=A0A2P2JZ51_RHIMU
MLHRSNRILCFDNQLTDQIRAIDAKLGTLKEPFNEG